MTENENDVLGFDPQDLFKNDEENSSKNNTNYVNSLIYHMRPVDVKEEVDKNHIYRATIKVVYNPFDRKKSFLNQQTYGLNDTRGFFSVISSLTLGEADPNAKNCPIFKAWKKCRYAKQKDGSFKSEADRVLWLQQAKEEEGGKALFDKRQARYCIVQILEDKNQPDLVGSFKLWKIPASIYKIIEQKQNPTDEKKAPIPVMDFLFGRAIDVEVTPGPGKPGDVSYTRQVDYTGELSEDIVSCVNPDGSPLLTSDENEILEAYVESMKKVWKSKDPEERKRLLAEVLAEENTAAFRSIYARVLEQIKSWSPTFDSINYKEWSADVAARVQNWINVVLEGEDPTQVASVTSTQTHDTESTEKNTDSKSENTDSTSEHTNNNSTSTASTASVSAEDETSDLPF